MIVNDFTLKERDWMEIAEDYGYELKVQKELFYSEDTMWGVYSFKFVNPEDARESGINLHKQWGTFTISGNVFQLTEHDTYFVSFEDSYTEKYGAGYGFIEVKTEGLRKRSAQVEFLNAVLPKGIAGDIDKKHSDNKQLLSDISSGAIDLLEIKNVTENNVEKYLKAIKEFDRYQEAIVLLAPLGVNIRTIKDLADQFGGAVQLLQVIDKNIYRLTNAKGFGFKRVDEYALKLGYSKSSKSRILAGAEYVLEQMSTFGDIKIDIEKFDSEMCRILEIDEVSDKIFSQIMDSHKFYYDGGFISLSKLRDEELSIAEKLVSLQRGATALEGFDEALAETIEQQEDLNGFAFTEEQKAAMSLLKDNGVAVINGRGGTGKSAITKTIVETLGKLHKGYAACSLSGKAANVLIQNGLHNASTIHRMLKWTPHDGFVYNEEKRLPYDLIILDEASMVNNTLFLNVVQAIKQGARFLLVGDSGQLPPIGHGAMFESLLRIDLPRVELTQVHRQAAKSGIITSANLVREHGQLNEYGNSENQVIGELKDMRIFNYLDKTSIYDDLMTTVERYHMNPNTNSKDIQVLTAMKKGHLGVPKLNVGIQDILNPHPDKGMKPHVKNKGMELRLGDRVIQNGNFYDASSLNNLKEYEEFKKGVVKSKLDEEAPEGNGYLQTTAVFNGTIGYVVDIFNDPMKIASGILVEYDTYAGKELVYYFHTEDKSDIGMLDLAYAITVHRSQGSGFKTVLLAFDYSAYMLLSKEFVYTGITRAINNCLMFVENSALHQAIKTTQSANRKTYIREFIKDKLKK